MKKYHCDICGTAFEAELPPGMLNTREGLLTVCGGDCFVRGATEKHLVTLDGTPCPSLLRVVKK